MQLNRKVRWNMCDYDEAQRFLDLVYIYKKDVYRIILSVVDMV